MHLVLDLVAPMQKPLRTTYNWFKSNWAKSAELLFTGRILSSVSVYDQKGVPGIGEVPVLAISSINIVRILDEI